MSAELQFSSSDQVEFPYRALSRAAIASLIFAVLATFGLFPTFELVLIFGLLGAIAALVALRTIGRFPEEYAGKALALVGLIGSLGILIGGVSMHAYIYLTEVPDGYSRVQFYELQQTNESIPDSPTPYASEIDGQDVFIKGYVHPASGGGLLKQFILVPDLGTCCFGGQPRSSDMIEVTTVGDVIVKGGLTRKKLAGKFMLNKMPEKLEDFDNIIFYRLRAKIAK